MKQLVQDLKAGAVSVAETPAPVPKAGQVLITSSRSLVSPGTERMLVEFARANWVDKVRQQPERVAQVLEKVRTDGLAATIEAVRSRLDEPLVLGYSNAGRVAEAGQGVSAFSVGDRVISNGPHAEVVVVSQNLCARIPDRVSDDEAAFTVVSAIALQGLRLAAPTLGERFVVTGLGLIGLTAVQLLRAHGCHVLGIDPDPARADLARSFGADALHLGPGEDPASAAIAFSHGRGVDGVLLTLASKSSEPVSQAARMCRKRGRIVLVGVTGLELKRADFYEKELSFQVSCSYGPGRYDPSYEDRGQDYPFGFVRWTAQRNFEAVLEMMASGALNVKPLISHRFPFEDAPKAYDLLADSREPSLGILLEYPGTAQVADRTVQIAAPRPPSGPESPVVLGVIGAGNYASRVLIPALRKTDAVLHTIANTGGVTGAHLARRHGFRQVTTDLAAILTAPEINTVVIATRHDSHARLVCEALAAGKHVFCEKPLALTAEELDRVRQAWESAAERQPRELMVGFNRRFSPLAKQMRALLESVREPKSFIVTVNAGAIPPAHWTQDQQIGGGRIVGEACHFIDLLRYLTGAAITGWSVQTLGRSPAIPVRDDKATITLTFADGSVGTIHYLANGHRSFPKERVEAFCAGRVLQLDNFRALRGYGWPGFRGLRQWRQDKGHQACADAFVSAVRDGAPAPIPFEEIVEVSRVSLGAAESAHESR